MAREITYNHFEISLVVFLPNITTNHAITYTNLLLRNDIFFPFCLPWTFLNFFYDFIKPTRVIPYV